MTNRQLLKPALVLSTAVLIVVVLVYAKPFLLPLTFAGLLSMLLLPLVKWFQREKNVPHALGILLGILALVAFFAGVIFFTSLQIADISKNSARLEQQVTGKYNSVRQYIAEVFAGISPEKQKQIIEKQQSSASGNTGSFITGFLTGIFGFFTDALLTLVYIFLFLFFRKKLKGFIVRMAPQDRAGDAMKTVSEAQKVSQQYLTGLFLMIVCLWIMYTIGFTIAGVKNALFFAIICALLEIVPFVGNLIGTALTLGMSLVQDGGSGVLIGVVITYVVVQFFQTYILEPMIVGAEVQINPIVYYYRIGCR